MALPICVKETRTTLALFLFARAMESLTKIGVQRKYIPSVPLFDVILFVIMVPFMAYTLFYHFDTFAKGTEKSLFRLTQLTQRERKLLGLYRGFT